MPDKEFRKKIESIKKKSSAQFESLPAFAKMYPAVNEAKALMDELITIAEEQNLMISNLNGDLYYGKTEE